jgi:hypothetical protein
VSGHTLATTVERQALRDINPRITARASPRLARGNIVQHLATARMHPRGGTGIKTTLTGHTVSFLMIWASSFMSSFGIVYAVIFRDERQAA